MTSTSIPPGLELSLSILEEYPDRETTIPVLASALEESNLSHRALEFLLTAPGLQTVCVALNPHLPALVPDAGAIRFGACPADSGAAQSLRSVEAFTRHV